MTTKITRACEYLGVNYDVGDTVPEEEHETAIKLTELGFASTTTTKTEAAAHRGTTKES